MNGDQSKQPGVVTDIIAGKVEILRNRFLPGNWSGPVLAEERALLRQLLRVAIGKAQSVAARE